MKKCCEKKPDWFNDKFDKWIKEVGGANATCG